MVFNLKTYVYKSTVTEMKTLIQSQVLPYFIFTEISLLIKFECKYAFMKKGLTKTRKMTANERKSYDFSEHIDSLLIIYNDRVVCPEVMKLFRIKSSLPPQLFNKKTYTILCPPIHHTRKKTLGLVLSQVLMLCNFIKLSYHSCLSYYFPTYVHNLYGNRL